MKMKQLWTMSGLTERNEDAACQRPEGGQVEDSEGEKDQRSLKSAGQRRSRQIWDPFK
jgi:hypothetical protein